MSSVMQGIGSFFNSGLGKGLLGLGGAALGAAGGSGQQQKTQGTTQTTGQSQTTGQQNFNTSQTGQTATQYGGTSTPTQSPEMTKLRNSLAQTISGQIQNANVPVYGQAQLAQFLNQQNDSLSSALAGAKEQLAGGGQLNSGALSNAVTGLNVGRLGNIANYQMETPLANRMAQSQLINPLLAQGGALAASAPTGYTTSGQTTGQTAQQGTGQQTSQQNTNYSQMLQQMSQLFGPSFGSGLMSNLGGLFGAGGMGYGPFAGLGGGGQQQNPTGGFGAGLGPGGLYPGFGGGGGVNPSAGYQSTYGNNNPNAVDASGRPTIMSQ